MRDLKALALGLFLTLASFTGAFAQCGTQAPANSFCGNNTGSQALAGYKAITPGVLAPIAGGTVIGNPTAGVLAPVATAAPVLGIPGTSTGQVGLAGSGSGTATIAAQATAGSATSLLPTVAGTLVGSASGPLAIGAATGTITCPTCATTTNGGAITGTAPITVSAAGVIALTNPLALNFGGTAANLTASNGGIIWSNTTQFQVLAGTATARQMLQSGATATPAWSTSTWPATTTINRVLFSSAANVIGEITTANGGMMNATSGGVPAMTVTPVLGVPTASQGTLGFAGATSGTATVTAQATAGSPVLTLPNTTGTFAVGASAPLVLSATTGNLTCCTGALTVTSASATSLTVGPAGASNPVLQVDSSTASQAAGWKFTGAATGGTVSLAAIDSGSNTNITIGPKGTGTTTIGNASGGAITLTGGSGGTTVNIGNGSSGLVGLFLAGNASGSTAINTQSAASGTMTLPNATDTFVGKATTDILTNKTYDSAGTGNVFKIGGVTVTMASAPTYLVGTSTSALLTPGVVFVSEQTTTFGATTTFDFSLFTNTVVTLTGNITTQTLSNIKGGQAGSIRFLQDGTGSRTTVWNSNFKFAGGVTPTLTTTINASDILSYNCITNTFCQASLMKDVK